jgi:hypothetical protein
VQVSAFYQQTSDIGTSELATLPATPFGDRMRNKQPTILTFTTACDQVAVLSVALTDFAVAADVKRFSPDPAAAFDSVSGPPLIPDPDGKAWVVTRIQAPLAKGSLWTMLLH